LVLIILAIVFRFIKKKLKIKIANEDKKMKYLIDRFMPLKYTKDPNWNEVIIDIKINKPFFKNGFWIIKKCLYEDNFIIYKKTDKELEIEMKTSNSTKNVKLEVIGNDTGGDAIVKIIDEPDDIPSWNCKKCYEEIEGVFDVCWKCQNLKELQKTK
ncbi:hypothetical protein OAR04_05015, partial [Flavobacteriales bacterium]|nr:hypothetical protein [Flavobacteriales bacterium]